MVGVLADAHPDHHHDQPADGQPDPLTATPTEILEPFDRRDRDGL
jgi:hypothetical protein